MKFIITGGAGFIGSHLAKKLLYGGKEVVIIDDFSTGKHENLKTILSHPNLTLVSKDILSVTDWDRLLRKNDIIIHLAATVGVNKVCINPLQTLQNNFQPTLTLLRLALRYQCLVFFASTSEVYGELANDFSTEYDPLVVPGTHCGRSSYVLGKILSEQYCMNFSRDFSLPVIVARFFNVTGLNQLSNYGMVVPTFIRQAISNEPITIFGEGDQTRSFCNVEDVVNAIITLVEKKEAYGQVFNIGGTETITIKVLATYIKQVLNSSSPIITLPLPRERAEGRDISRRSASIEKIRSLTGWEPVISWKETIDSMIRHKKSTADALSACL